MWPAARRERTLAAAVDLAAAPVEAAAVDLAAAPAEAAAAEL